MTALYDRIAPSYAAFRRPDPRIAEKILRALGDSRMIVNVGAGTGSYEPRGRSVVAVEPSRTMIEQRGETAAPAVQAAAEHLPFASDSFDAALALLTVHHWQDPESGLAELARVARNRIVIFTWEPAVRNSWLTRDYFTEIWEYDLEQFPPAQYYAGVFGKVTTEPVLIPYDCTDGFLEAYWRRPETYFNPAARSAISSFARIPYVEERLSSLRSDLDDGTWERRNGHLLTQTELDLGYRLIVAEVRKDL